MNDYVPLFLTRMLERELQPGERVVWQARPSPFRFIGRFSKKFLGGIPFLAFAIFWMWGATGHFNTRPSSKGSWPIWFPILWGGMFVAIGASMLLSPIWHWWVAKHSLYAITDRRAILIEAPLRRTIQSFAGERLITTVRREDNNGRGDIIFEREAEKGSKGRTFYRDIGFFGLADARATEQILQKIYADTRKA